MLKKYQANHVWINNKRHYRIDNKSYVGVTTVLKETMPEKDRRTLENWKRRIGHEEADNVSKSAIARGTELHQLIENELLGEKPIKYSDTVAGFWEYSQEQIKALISNVQLIEGTIWHNEYRIAGTVDCVADFEGKLTVIDWKTSSKIKKPEWITDYCLQLSAYRQCMKEVYGLDIKHGVIFISLEFLPPQIFKFDYDEMMHYWSEYENRFGKYCLKKMAGAQKNTTFKKCGISMKSYN